MLDLDFGNSTPTPPLVFLHGHRRKTFLPFETLLKAETRRGAVVGAGQSVQRTMEWPLVLVAMEEIDREVVSRCYWMLA